MFKVEHYLKVPPIGAVFNSGRAVDYYRIIEHLTTTPIWLCQVTHPVTGEHEDEVGHKQQFFVVDVDSLLQICRAMEWLHVSIHIMLFPGTSGNTEPTMKHCLKIYEAKLKGAPPRYKVQTVDGEIFLGFPSDADPNEVHMELVWDDGVMQS